MESEEAEEQRQQPQLDPPSGLYPVRFLFLTLAARSTDICRHWQ
jgi:hypothetical protein